MIKLRSIVLFCLLIVLVFATGIFVYFHFKQKPFVDLRVSSQVSGKKVAIINGEKLLEYLELLQLYNGTRLAVIGEEDYLQEDLVQVKRINVIYTDKVQNYSKIFDETGEEAASSDRAGLRIVRVY